MPEYTGNTVGDRWVGVVCPDTSECHMVGKIGKKSKGEGSQFPPYLPPPSPY